MAKYSSSSCASIFFFTKLWTKDANFTCLFCLRFLDLWSLRPELCCWIFCGDQFRNLSTLLGWKLFCWRSRSNLFIVSHRYFVATFSPFVYYILYFHACICARILCAKQWIEFFSSLCIGYICWSKELQPLLPLGNRLLRANLLYVCIFRIVSPIISATSCCVCMSLAVVSLVAGNGATVFANGIGSTAQINGPTDVFCGLSGVCYVNEYGNNRIRQISTSGSVIYFYYMLFLH